MIPGVKFQLYVQASPTSTNNFTVLIQINIEQSLKTLFYSLLFVKNSSNLPSNVRLFRVFTSTYGAQKYQNFYSFNSSYFGPSFNKKCLIAHKSLQFAYNYDFTIQLINSSLNNYYQINSSSNGYLYDIFDFVCFSDTSKIVLGDFEYLD